MQSRGGRLERSSLQVFHRRSHLLGKFAEPCRAVLCCAAFQLSADLILKSFSAFTQIKMMTTLAKANALRHGER